MIVVEDVKIVLNGQSMARAAQMTEELGFPVHSEESMLEFIADAINKTRKLQDPQKKIEMADLVEHFIYEVTYYWVRMSNPTSERTFMLDRLYGDAKYDFRFRPKGSAPSLVGDDITFPVGMYKAIMCSDEVLEGK